MIKLSQILKAINLKIAEEFTGIEVDSKNLSEKFNRPSFRTEIDGLKTEKIMNQGYKKREFIIRIYFFPTEIIKNRIEKLEITDKLENIFFPAVQVTKDFYLPVDEISFDESEDGVLIASFETLTMEEIEKDIGLEDMEELTYRII